jgi:hypothetical protein
MKTFCLALWLIFPLFMSATIPQQLPPAPEQPEIITAQQRIPEVRPPEVPVESKSLAIRGFFRRLDRAENTMVIQTIEGEMMFDVATATIKGLSSINLIHAGEEVTVTYKQKDGKYMAIVIRSGGMPEKVPEKPAGPAKPAEKAWGQMPPEQRPPRVPIIQ